MPYIHETFLVYKLKTFKTCKDVWHIIIIMIIAIIYIFFILCDIWSTVENYFQKILRSPWKNHSPLFTHSTPKNSKSASLLNDGSAFNGNASLTMAMRLMPEIKVILNIPLKWWNCPLLFSALPQRISSKRSV